MDERESERTGTMDYATLDALRTHHPAWRLLASPHAALIASFLHRVFVVPNVRTIPAADLVEALEDELYTLRVELGAEAFPKPALDYLNDWAASNKGWLRKFYRQGTDEAQFDLTPSTAKAIAWLGTLGERHFVGTESRLLTLFDLLRQMSEGSEIDPQKRLDDLRARRAAIDDDIAKVQAGEMGVLDDTAIKDRFQQFTQMARELLTDFREVEDNFRALDRRVRERIALWDGGKGGLLEQVMGERDAIADSDQGRSFRAFWDFLMSAQRQEELTVLLDRVLVLPALDDVRPEPRLRRIHYDWLEAGDYTQRTVAQLSQQLRHFLDDQAWLENRRIMDLLRAIEAKALVIRDLPPPADIAVIDESSASVELPMERPLYRHVANLRLLDRVLEAGDEDVDPAALYSQVFVDTVRLSTQIRGALVRDEQVSLRDLVEAHPLQQGLAELIGYLHLASDTFTAVADEATPEPIVWQAVTAAGDRVDRSAALPRIVFVR